MNGGHLAVGLWVDGNLGGGWPSQSGITHTCLWPKLDFLVRSALDPESREVKCSLSVATHPNTTTTIIVPAPDW